MLAVLGFFALFVLGVIAIAILEPVMRLLLKPLDIPADVVQAVFIGAGALVTLPFVLSILAEAHVSIVASLIWPRAHQTSEGTTGSMFGKQVRL